MPSERGGGSWAGRVGGEVPVVEDGGCEGQLEGGPLGGMAPVRFRAGGAPSEAGVPSDLLGCAASSTIGAFLPVGSRRLQFPGTRLSEEASPFHFGSGAMCSDALPAPVACSGRPGGEGVAALRAQCCLPFCLEPAMPSLSLM